MSSDINTEGKRNSNKIKMEAIEALKEAGYEAITPENMGIGLTGNIPDWLKEYFSTNESLDDFVRRNDYDGLEVMKNDLSRGYVFVGPLQLDRDYELRMQDIRKRFCSLGRRTIKYFVDLENELAGFSWSVDGNLRYLI